MSWWQVSAPVPAALAEAVAWVLAERADVAVEVQDAGTLTSGESAEIARVVVALAEPPDELFRRHVVDALALFGLGDVTVRTREQADDGWRDGWRAFFTARRLSPRFAVRPPWEGPLAGVAHTLVIDPGLAFGTGTHATTRGVIKVLDAALGDQAPLRLLDVGTGSGILAIAAARLGHEVVAVEPDAVALRNTRENVAANDVAARIELVLGSAADVEGRFPLVVANIIAPILVAIAPAITARCADALILSGLLVGQEEMVRSAYPGFEPVARHVEGEWLVLHLRASAS